MRVLLVTSVLLLAALAATASDMSRKKTTTTTTTTTTEEPVVTEPPPWRGDYERMGDFGYYKIYNTYSTWWGAWRTCFLEGSHLLVLRSQEEYNALRSWKPGYQVPNYSWYGAHHRFRSQEFVTLFDEPLAESGYYKWSQDFTTNRTLYNNVDYPDMVVNILDEQSTDQGFRLVYKQTSKFFICKMEI